MAVLDSNKKADIYETLTSINMAFAGIVMHLRSMRQAGILSRKYARLFNAFALEVRGEINIKILLALHGIEEDDWARYGQVRGQWEKYLSGESDEVFPPAGGGRIQTKKEHAKSKTPTPPSKARARNKRHKALKPKQLSPRMNTGKKSKSVSTSNTKP